MNSQRTSAVRFRAVRSRFGGLLRLAALAGLLAQLGCGVNTLDDGSSDPSRNSCENSDECGAGATCEANVCRASQGELDSVLLAVTAGSTTMGVGGVRFLLPVDGLSQGSQVFELPLTPPSVVTGTVTVGETPVNCDVHVTFTPVERVLGLSPEEYIAVTSAGKLTASIPAGNYDVYVQHPTDSAFVGCEIVPRLYRHVEVGAGVFDLPLALGETQELSLQFVAGQADLTGFRASVLDSVSGRMLSNEVTLDASQLQLDAYSLRIQFNQVASDAVAGQELIQLRPPDGVTAPTLVWKREGLEIFSPGELAMDLSSVDFEMGSYAGFVDGPDRTQQSATLRFTSTSLDGLGDGVLGAFTTTTMADESGAFALDSVPLGTYRVQVTPSEGSGLGATEVEIKVTGKGEGGGTILLESRSAIAGSVVFDQAGAPAVAGATVHAVATPRQVEFQAFRQALGDKPFVPRASSGITSQTGTFKLDADPGTFDISVRPPAGSNLPWLVRTNVSVPLASAGLGQLEIHAPVLHSGVVTLNGMPVAGASVRAYAYVGSSGYVADQSQAQSVVAVGEAYADASGRFVLALPSR